MGGAIGVCFFLANSVGITFYLQGFTDTLGSLLQVRCHGIPAPRFANLVLLSAHVH
eukprot:SAG31_NODE_36230_length_315_cov_0.949074_1_plen_55_part_01